MRRRLGVITALGASLAVVLAGCSDDESAAPAPAPEQESSESAPASESSGAADGASDEAVTWIDGFCGSVGSLAGLAQLKPPETDPGDFEATKAALSDMLGSLDTAVSDSLDGLNKLGPAPAPEGDTAKTALVDTFTPVQQTVSDAKSKVEQATQENPQPMMDALSGVQTIGSSLSSMQNPLGEIGNSPELVAAGEKAPNCQKLNN